MCCTKYCANAQCAKFLLVHPVPLLCLDPGLVPKVSGQDGVLPHDAHLPAQHGACHARPAITARGGIQMI